MPSALDTLKESWQSQWPRALACWSHYVKLSEPRWCLTAGDAQREGLTDSFAMIRLHDHAIVVALRQIQTSKLENFAVEILAHEIGHHVYCPADLLDNARLLARTRRGLPTRETSAPMIANLYADLLINDRLQRTANLNMFGVYEIMEGENRQSNQQNSSRLWTLYLRIYEVLWSLPKNQLASGKIDEQLDADAVLGARVIRSYAQDWLGGAGRFAMLCLPYLIEDRENTLAQINAWLDAMKAGADPSGGVPDGLTEIDADEIAGAIHPAFDPKISGIKAEAMNSKPGEGVGRGSTEKDMSHREPLEYGEILKALGVNLSDHEIAVKYYRERARPHLIRFPQKPAPQSMEPQAEGLEEWTLGSSLESIDWLHSTVYSPHIIPGLTTLRRIWSDVPGGQPEATPLDLYIGIDCSGSMIDPRRELSYPVLAGAIVALSALRVGAKVKVVLSGEPGNSIATDGFIRDENTILKTLTDYLGSGYAFGIHRLEETFTEVPTRPVHVLVITDHDIFLMLEQEGTTGTYNSPQTGRGWNVARECLALAGGGGTYVLHMDAESETAGIARMQNDGWNVHCIRDWPDIIAFARAFVRENYEVLNLQNSTAK
jgi:hypothetical protein